LRPFKARRSEGQAAGVLPPVERDSKAGVGGRSCRTRETKAECGRQAGDYCRDQEALAAVKAAKAAAATSAAAPAKASGREKEAAPKAVESV